MQSLNYISSNFESHDNDSFMQMAPRYRRNIRWNSLMCLPIICSFSLFKGFSVGKTILYPLNKDWTQSDL